MPMPHTPDREAHTSCMLMWQEAAGFVKAAGEIPHYRTPRLHLATHGIELALKSHLRANGYTLDQLRALGHSLLKSLTRCKRLGFELPSMDNMDRLRLLSKAHAAHEWRYAHTDRPPHMEWGDWVLVADWALSAAIPAVGRATVDDVRKIPNFERRMRTMVVEAVDPRERD
jgi:hypothetical protein